eukprot:TRINITY_DN7594_c1_g1_i2.p1 TRINITY_DN7594_c1_g1~~TRINITY_DN7594_c1_g1_i2.p1  ORF type:complete len:830 (+),score=147.68 TRINITY_DN7594_c1_g1_i2:212-2701(+)
MGDPVALHNGAIAVTTTCNPNGEVITSMRSPRRGHQVMSSHEGLGLVEQLKGLSDLFAQGRLSSTEYETCKLAVINGFQKGSPPPHIAGMPPVNAIAPPPGGASFPYEVSSPSGSPSPAGQFTLLMCAEIYGQKVNIELDFTRKPSVSELIRRAEEVFSAEAAATKLPQHPVMDIRFVRVQIFNDNIGTWCDLITKEQMKDFSQLHGFLPDSIWQTPGPAPAPRDIPAPKPAALSGVPTSSPTPTGIAPVQSSSPAQQRFIVNWKSGSVPLRDTPSDGGVCLTWLPDQTVVVELLQMSPDSQWRYVECDGKTGYVATKYLTPSQAAIPATGTNPTASGQNSIQQSAQQSVQQSAQQSSLSAAVDTQNSVRGVAVTISAHLFGSIVTIPSEVDMASLTSLSRTIERILISEAKNRCPAAPNVTASISDESWSASIKIKTLQVHDPVIDNWVDLYSTNQVLPNCSIFVQLTTSNDSIPSVGSNVMLAPGHAPELLATGCLRPGEFGTIMEEPRGSENDKAVLPITVTGPRGDTFVYFKDDLMVVIVSQSVSDAAPLSAKQSSGAVVATRNPLSETIEDMDSQIEYLATRKATAVETENFEEAQELKQQLDQLIIDRDNKKAELEASRHANTFAGTPTNANPDVDVDDLIRQKEEAAEAEDYVEAHRLKLLIDELISTREHRLSESPDASVPMIERFRRGMTHIHASKQLLDIADSLHMSDPSALYNAIAEFQPTLTLQKIQKNWRKIVLIYVSHAEATLREQQVALAEQQHTEPTIHYPELAGQLKGVINFIDSPLSPRTLRDVRHIRKTGSPRNTHSVGAINSEMLQIAQ